MGGEVEEGEVEKSRNSAWRDRIDLGWQPGRQAGQALLMGS